MSTNVMFYLEGFSIPFQSIDNLGVGGFGFARYGFFLACLVAALFLTFFAKWVERFEIQFSIAVPLLTLIGILLYSIAGHQDSDIADISAALGSLFVGFGYIWYNMRLCHISASIKTPEVVIATIACSITLTTLLFASILALAPKESHLLIAAILSLAGAFSIKQASRAQAKLTQPLPLSFIDKNHSAILKTKESRRKQIGQLALVSVVLIVMRGLMDSGIWGSTLTSSTDPASLPWAFVIVILFSAISVPTFLLYAKSTKGYHYHLPFLVLIAGFFIILLTKEQISNQQVVSMIESSIELLCQMLFSYTLINSARLLNISGFRIAGCTLAFTYVIVIFWTIFMEGMEFTSSAIILIAAYFLIVFVGTPSLPHELIASTGSEQQNPPAKTHETIATESCRIAKENGLTNRETEILVLLLQGRSLPYIQRKLVLAEGTVKTHVSHIYKKLNVHSKQELIDLLPSRTVTPSDEDLASNGIH